jgi:hypothetical protein
MKFDARPENAIMETYEHLVEEDKMLNAVRTHKIRYCPASPVTHFALECRPYRRASTDATTKTKRKTDSSENVWR